LPIAAAASAAAVAAAAAALARFGFCLAAARSAARSAAASAARRTRASSSSSHVVVVCRLSSFGVVVVAANVRQAHFSLSRRIHAGAIVPLSGPKPSCSATESFRVVDAESAYTLSTDGEGWSAHVAASSFVRSFSSVTSIRVRAADEMLTCCGAPSET
jgi:hypothetical protein